MTPLAVDTAAQLLRLLALLPRYADQGEVEIAEVASELHVTPEQVRRDLRALDDYEDRGGFIEKFKVTLGQTRLSVEARVFRRPMKLAREEVRALELGLSLLRHERVEPARQPVEVALMQVRKLLSVPDVPSGEIAGDQSAGDPAVLELLRRGRQLKRAVRFTYAPGDGLAAPRVVTVYATISASGMWYAVGPRVGAGDVRVYRLDRMTEATLTEIAYEIPDDFDPDEWTASGRVLRAADAPRLHVRYSAAVARWIAEREGVPLAADGTLEVEHPLADEAWAVRHLLQYGPEVEVLSPPSVQMALLTALDAMLEWCTPQS